MVKFINKKVILIHLTLKEIFHVILNLFQHLIHLNNTKKLTKLSAIILIILLINPSYVYPQFQGSPMDYVFSITEDEEGKRIHYPSKVFFDQSRKEIYIIDNSSRLNIYTYDFFPIYTLQSSDGIDSPQGVAIDSEGNLYVLQSSSKENPKNRITIFDVCLNLDKEFPIEGFEGYEKFTPSNIAIDSDGIIYIAGSYYPGVVKFKNDGTFLGILSPQENGKKILINNITIDNDGNLYLLSEEESHIYVYDRKERFLFRFGEKGGCTGKLSRPQAVAIDNKYGRVYVVDYMRHTITTYDKFGKYMFEFGGLGWGEGWFQYPKDITVDHEGKVLIADTFNDRVQILKASELYIQQLNIAHLEGK